MIKYQHNTNIHAPAINVTATSDSIVFAIGFSTLVIFQMRCAEPLNDNGADTTTFSDANWRLIFLFYSIFTGIISDVNCKDFLGDISFC